jgi:maleate isomerase
MLTPSSNTCLEPVTCAIVREIPDVSVHFARFSVTRISLDRDALEQFDATPMLAAARLLADARVHAIVWNGTSGAWLGLDVDRTLCRRIQEDTGIPATTASLAQVEAFRRYQVTRYALAVPYTAPVTEQIVRTYAREGFECVRARHLGISENFAFNEVPPQRIEALVESVATSEAEAISVVCTNFPAAPLVQRLEDRTGLPIFDSTILGIWKGLDLLGIQRPVRGWGRLVGAGSVPRGPAGGD